MLAVLCCLAASAVAPAVRADDLPAPVLQLMALDPVALAKKYQSLPEPNEKMIPTGFAIAEHIVPIYDAKTAPNGVPVAPALLSKAQLPSSLTFAAFKLLKGKQFDAKSRTMSDKLKIPVPSFGQTKALLSVGKIDDALSAAFEADAQPNIGDGKMALITNYRVMNQLVGDASGWIDELRLVSKGLWLGRSFYKGKFWCYIIVYFSGK
jgi:hypothetical protein